MRKRDLVLGAAAVAMLWGAVGSAALADGGPLTFESADFWDVWGDGKAELAAYDLTYPRYGESREGVAVTIFVTETFSDSMRVKADPGLHPKSDEFPVMKLNLVEDFPTGIYDYNLMTSASAQKAFDVHSEPEKVREAYGKNSFGQRALLARRLVEAGVPFVTLYEGGWDHHSDIFTGLPKKLVPFENTIAALIEDLEDRPPHQDTRDGEIDTDRLVVGQQQLAAEQQQENLIANWASYAQKTKHSPGSGGLCRTIRPANRDVDPKQ